VLIVNCHARWLAFALPPVYVVVVLLNLTPLSLASVHPLGGSRSKESEAPELISRCRIKANDTRNRKARCPMYRAVVVVVARRPSWYHRCSRDECTRDESTSSVCRIDQILYTRPPMMMLDEVEKDANGRRQGFPVNRVFYQQSPRSAVVPPR
jgi:hypothetical protein